MLILAMTSVVVMVAAAALLAVVVNEPEASLCTRLRRAARDIESHREVAP